MLDHLLWGVSDLDAGIRDIADRSGVQAMFGGSHPGVGTHNALIDLQDQRYLEIIAPDPAQEQFSGFGALLRQLQAPSLLTWAARSDDIEAVASAARGAGLQPGEIYRMSRQRPDGDLLQGRILQFEDHAWGPLLPFFIQIDGGTHPSLDAPSGCRLDRFSLVHPEAQHLGRLLGQLGLETDVRSGSEPALKATIDAPIGRFDLTGPPPDVPTDEASHEG
ncbi:MAG: VOC family protein [Acidobacteriota bacterium]